MQMEIKRLCVPFLLTVVGILFLWSSTRNLLPKAHYSIEKLMKGTKKIKDQKLYKLHRLNNNSVFKFYNLTAPKERKKKDIIVIVSSSPYNKKFRDSIRETWFTQCISDQIQFVDECMTVRNVYFVDLQNIYIFLLSNNHYLVLYIPWDVKLRVFCMFFTDLLQPSDKLHAGLVEEQLKHKDMHFQVSRNRMDFGGRFLYQMYWTYLYYEYDYYLRMDDDVYLCLERFLKELPIPPVTLQYGHVHCTKDIVRIDEAYVLLSIDIVEAMLTQDPENMECHLYAGLQMGLWNENLNLKDAYLNDNRFVFTISTEIKRTIKTRKNICKDYIGVHGVSPTTMSDMWASRIQGINFTKSLLNYTSGCKLDKVLKKKLFRQNIEKCKSHTAWGKPGLFHHGAHKL